MTGGPSVDGMLVLWGERLFYPPNRIVRTLPTPRLTTLLRRKAGVIRRRIEATLAAGPQVVVKVAGGGRGMKDIAAHFRYISRNGTLEMEDDRGVRSAGREALHDLEEQWRHGGARIDLVSPRREAINLLLSMPHGTPPDRLLRAAREFAREALPEHTYVFVLHEHQAHPHVHLAVRLESRSGQRLRSWVERYRWRELFAQKLREQGVPAEASSQVVRGANHRPEPLWLVRGRKDGALPPASTTTKQGTRYRANRAEAMRCWAQLMKVLADSPDAADRALSARIATFVQRTPFLREQAGLQPDRTGGGRAPAAGGPRSLH
ncbi:MAG TPA: conjugal transfer protein TraS, partial [Roseateles sp.]